MKIETKYNVGQNVWYVDRSVHKSAIISVRVEQSLDSFGKSKDVTIKYFVGMDWRFENELFLTKDELLKSL